MKSSGVVRSKERLSGDGQGGLRSRSFIVVLEEDRHGFGILSVVYESLGQHLAIALGPRPSGFDKGEKRQCPSVAMADDENARFV